MAVDKEFPFNLKRRRGRDKKRIAERAAKITAHVAIQEYPDGVTPLAADHFALRGRIGSSRKKLIVRAR
jgi:hypothetical protein